MAFVAGAALPLTSRRPARATCTTMMAEGGEKKSLGKWVRLSYLATSGGRVGCLPALLRVYPCSSAPSSAVPVKMEKHWSSPCALPLPSPRAFRQADA